ncbi:hypothetical protein ACOSZH_01255 [Priestia megaterium]|uniref:hypothetical protein n=1 Tax=Priestia megaterium TaxID=1404 RepID=UPI003BA1DAA7
MSEHQTSQYKILMNSLAQEIPHRPDLLDGMNELIEKYEICATTVVNVNRYKPDLDDLAQANISALTYKNNSLEEKNERLTQLLKGAVELL